MTTSKSIINQLDYIQTMKLINEMLVKPNNNLGSVQIGQKYATFYLEKINQMLLTEYIDREILEELKIKVKNDLEDVRNDCKHRINHKDVNDNNHMMSMILDFILTL